MLAAIWIAEAIFMKASRSDRMGLVSLAKRGEKMKGDGASVAQSGPPARSEVVPGRFFRLIMWLIYCMYI